MKTDLFQSCGHCWVFQICWHIECNTFTASSFRTWNSWTGIPSPPLALKPYEALTIWKDLKVQSVQFSLVAQSCTTLQPHEPKHTRPPCPSPTPRVYPNSCPLSRWCHLTTSSSVIPFSSYLQSFPTSRSFQMSQFFTSGSQSIGVSASTSVLPVNTQDWFPLGWTGWISLQSQESSPTQQFKSINSSALSFL